MGMYTINGQRIAVQETGSPHNQVALLIHGWSGSRQTLAPLLPLLSKRFRCIAVDLPGYGASPPPRGRISIAGYADLLASLIQTVADGPVVLVGHSMGGMISLTLAINHPILIERMVLVNPAISGRFSLLASILIPPIALLEHIAPVSQFAQIHPALLQKVTRLLQPGAFMAQRPTSAQVSQQLWADAVRPRWRRVQAACYRAMREGDLRDKLSQVEAPSLALWGAEDPIIPSSDTGAVVDKWMNAELRIIPKAGHWLQFEALDIIERHIASFLGILLHTDPLATMSEPSAKVREAAQFLAHSDVGNKLSLIQRTRLAAQLTICRYPPNSIIAHAQDESTDLYIVQDGTIEVWSDPPAMGLPFGESQQLASFHPGQMTGELALLDGQRRSAELRAGAEGATVMVLQRERLLSLCEDDPALGNQVVWNIASTLALRLRLTTSRLEMVLDPDSVADQAL